MPNSCYAAVIIPTYNNTKDFTRAVDSVIASARKAHCFLTTPLKLDIVLIDDCSSDDTADLASQMAQTRDLPNGTQIIPTRHQKNKGAGPARNTGVNSTEADFIFFLDADDEFLEPQIGASLQKLTQSPHLGYVWGRINWDVPVHPSWQCRLDETSVQNLCIRRIWHEICGGFPEHPDFRDHGHEDCYYRAVLRRLIRGEATGEYATHIHLREGNCLEAQSEKFANAYDDWDTINDTRQPTAAMIADLEQRLETIKQIREDFLKSP